MKLFNEVENPLIPVLAGIEKEGITIDANAMAESSKELAGYIAELEQRIFDIAGTSLTLARPNNSAKYCLINWALQDKTKKTKTGQHATGEEILSKLAAQTRNCPTNSGSPAAYQTKIYLHRCAAAIDLRTRMAGCIRLLTRP